MQFMIIHDYGMYIKMLSLIEAIIHHINFAQISLDKNFAKHSYLCIAEIFTGINFTNVVKVTISSI